MGRAEIGLGGALGKRQSLMKIKKDFQGLQLSLKPSLDKQGSARKLFV